ncbi:hypothetical protein FisN_30Hh024 [Fistulifera solaris]|uniref:Uncharacterized protein n=1 Tax=Fistulifera solaris TaxID=1519565 RepID=A0A1Z5K6G5_FISSO|nr:hypothetical protein FisN_30Hh024 [Fistulifera solaris]|eukprot:GAX21824.1 hypothetical protein FisN_30Hh024 [Fistulifera solaris]
MNTEVTTTAEVNEELSCNNDDDDYTQCPLFMQSLPADFAAHPALAALASLIPTEDDMEAPPVPYVVIQREASEEEEEVTIPRGGGKVRAPKRRTHRRSAPYPKPKKPTTTTVGEAQLFLRLWKL